MPERAVVGAAARPEAARVALVIGQLTVGGAEGQLAQVVRALGARFEPVVLSLTDDRGALRDQLAGTGVAIHSVVGRGFRRARALAQTLRSERIDLVHSWLFIANAYVLAARAFGARMPMITSARNCKVQGRVSQVANAMAFRASRAIVVNSKDVDAYIRRHYWAPPGKIRLVQNGVDTDRFRPASDGGDADARQRPIVTVGRLVPQKNHRLFLDAAAELLQKRPQQRFVIVGDGPLRRELGAQADTLGISAAVTFAGERGDVDAVLRQASLFWLTSRWEGMPNVVLEALASGVPVVATDVGGTRELIRPGVEGFVIESGDHDALVRRSFELLTSAASFPQFSKAARARALEFSMERMIAALSDVYEEALAGSS